jgi:hypothetical protein
MDKCDGQCCKSRKHVGGGNFICIHKNLKIEHPELISEWYSEEDMKNFSSGSRKKSWWKCPINPCGCHIYEATIYNRTKKSPTGCPYCCSQKLCDHNNLLAIYPELEIEWDPENGSMTNFAPKSNIIVKWNCKNDPCGCHKWETAVSSRTKKKLTGCPYCCCQKLCDHNNLLAIHPDLEKEWHPDNKPMKNYSPGSDEKVKWKCSKNKNHVVWETQIGHRTGKIKSGCPKCANIKHGNNSRLSLEEFISKAIKVHGDVYDYSEAIYIGMSSRVSIICRKHGSFGPSALNHVYNKSGCPKCMLCPSCMLWRTRGILCSYCKPKNQNTLYFKTKEMDVVKYLKTNLPDEVFIHNKSVGKDCTNGHLFPDILFNCSYYCIIVEIDEHKHRGASYKCDKQRMYDIISKLGLPCIFIRYNPDHKDSDKSALLEMLTEYLAIQYDEEYFDEGLFPWNDFGYRCEYLYYH